MQPGLTIFTCRNVPTTSQDKDIHVFEKNHLLLFDLMQVFAFHLRRPQVRPRPIGGEWGRPIGGEFWRKVHPPQIHLAAAAAAASAAAAPRCCCCLFARACRQQQGPGGRKRLIFRGCFSNLQVHTTSLAQGLGLQASGLVKLTCVYVVSFINPFAFGLAFSSQAGP